MHVVRRAVQHRIVVNCAALRRGRRCDRLLQRALQQVCKEQGTERVALSDAALRQNGGCVRRGSLGEQAGVPTIQPRHVALQVRSAQAGGCNQLGAQRRIERVLEVDLDEHGVRLRFDSSAKRVAHRLRAT